MISFPILYGRSSKDLVKIWEIFVEEKNGVPTIITKHGYQGKKIITTAKEITEGKNIGKSNETTPFEQAVSEAQSTWTNKKDHGYQEDNPPEIGSILYLPMLAQDYKNSKRHIVYPCYAQPKMNGVRSISNLIDKQKVKYISRNGKLYNTVQHLDEELSEFLEGRSDIFGDGELYKHTWSFQEIIRNVKKQRETSNEIEYWIYDMAELAPKMNFEKRLDYISNKFSKINFKKLIQVPTIKINNENEMLKLHDKFISEMYEGIILRNINGQYTFDYRNKDLQKYKVFEDSEFMIVGGEEGTGVEKGCVIFIVQLDVNPSETFSVRPKGSRELRKSWLQNIQSLKGLPLTVRFIGRSETGVPVHATGIAIRDYE